jgi:hypothetical protein
MGHDVPEGKATGGAIPCREVLAAVRATRVRLSAGKFGGCLFWPAAPTEDGVRIRTYVQV